MGLWNIMCILNVHFSTDTNLLQSANVMSLYGGPLVDFLGPPHHVLVLADGKELAGLFKEIIIRIIAFIYYILNY